ncbi:hypothetical protein D3C81_2134840 [compost metagenome]
MAYSTSRMEFLVAMPISMIIPIMAGMLRLVPVTNSARIAPGIDNSSAPRIVTGCTQAWNSNTSTM